MERAPEVLVNRVRRYTLDLDSMLSELARVLRSGSYAHFVIGDCTVKGFDIYNSRALMGLAKRHGFVRPIQSRRQLDMGRRYLPPPGKTTKKGQIGRRMWEEVIVRFQVT